MVKTMTALTLTCVLLLTLLGCKHTKPNTSKAPNEFVQQSESVSEPAQLPGYLSATEFNYNDSNCFRKQELDCACYNVDVSTIMAGQSQVIGSMEYRLGIYSVVYLSGNGQLDEVVELILSRVSASDDAETVVYRRLLDRYDFEKSAVILPYAQYVESDAVSYWLIFDGVQTHVLINEPMGTIPGKVTQISNGGFIAREIKDVLGYKYVYVPYSISSKGFAVNSVEFDVEHIDEAGASSHSYHLVKNEFLAYVNVSGTIEKRPIEAGTRIVFTRTDLFSCVYFITDDNNEGYFDYVFNMDNPLIDGKLATDVLD